LRIGKFGRLKNSSRAWPHSLAIRVSPVEAARRGSSTGETEMLKASVLAAALLALVSAVPSHAKTATETATIGALDDLSASRRACTIKSKSGACRKQMNAKAKAAKAKAKQMKSLKAKKVTQPQKARKIAATKSLKIKRQLKVQKTLAAKKAAKISKAKSLKTKKIVAKKVKALKIAKKAIKKTGAKVGKKVAKLTQKGMKKGVKAKRA
jgi:hypothetical protein